MLRALGWTFVLALLVVGWAGWRAYDYRLAIREANSLGLRFIHREPLDRIREKGWGQWRGLFEQATWERTAALNIDSPTLTTHVRLVRRLNPTHLYINDFRTKVPAPAQDISSSLRGLHIRSLGVANVESLHDLNGLKALPELESLNVTGCFNLEDVGGVNDLKRLKSLSIAVYAPVQNIQGINDLPALEELTLGGFEFSEWSGRKQLPKLRSLHLRDCPNLQSLEGFELLAGLELVEVHNCSALENLKGLTGLKKLRGLVVSYCPSLTSLAGLKNGPGFDSFSVTNCPNLGNFEPRE